MIKMVDMDTVLILRWAKEHNRLHNQMRGEFRVFSLKCKHKGMVINDILPHPGRCCHNDATTYTQGFTNCSMMRCPVLRLKNHY